MATIILPKLPTLFGNFCKGVKIIHFWATFIDIWRFLSGHTDRVRHFWRISFYDFKRLRVKPFPHLFRLHLLSKEHSKLGWGGNNTCMASLHFYKFGFNCFTTYIRITTYCLCQSNPILLNWRPAVQWSFYLGWFTRRCKSAMTCDWGLCVANNWKFSNIFQCRNCHTAYNYRLIATSPNGTSRKLLDVGWT